jgi:hypothetical protein
VLGLWRRQGTSPENINIIRQINPPSLTSVQFAKLSFDALRRVLEGFQMLAQRTYHCGSARWIQEVSYRGTYAGKRFKYTQVAAATNRVVFVVTYIRLDGHDDDIDALGSLRSVCIKQGADR